MHIKKFESSYSKTLIISLFVAFLLILNIKIINNVTPIGYVLDIYSQLNEKFWLISILIYFLGCILILQKEFLIRRAGIFFLLLNYIIPFFVPYRLMYYTYGTSDELYHIGEFKSIISNGIIDPDNIYPNTHIIYSLISLLCNLNPNIVSLILPLFFSLLFILGIYLLSKKILSFEPESIKIVVPVSLIYYFGHFHFSNVPNYTSLTIIPIFSYSLIRYAQRRSFSNSVMLTVFILFIPFSHPFVFLFISYILFSVLLYQNILQPKLNIKSKISNFNTIIWLYIITFFFWFTNGMYMNTFFKIYNSFVKHLLEPVLVESLDKVSVLNLSEIDLVKFIFIYGGRFLIPLIVIFIFLIFISINKEKISNYKLKPISYLIIMLVLFGSFQLFFLLNPFIVHSPDRITNLNFAVFIFIPLFSIAIKYLLNIDYKSNNWKKTIFFSFILSMIFASSLYGAFYSPYIHRPNIAGTYNEVQGMEWLFTYKGEMPIYDLAGDVGYRYSILINGISETKDRYGKDIFWSTAKIPDHFGYDQNKSFIDEYKYIVITSRSKLLYTSLYSELERYNYEDFFKFENDPNVVKLYDSLNINIYLA